MAWNPAWANAIASIESQGSGGYSAVGPTTAKGNRAYGKYQVMDFNIPTWTEKHLGQRLTPEQFLASPEAQDAVFQGEFGSSVQKYGNPQDAASVWFTGRPASQGAGRSDILGTTGSEYVNKFNSALGQGMTTSTKGPQMMQEQKPQGLLGSLGIQKRDEAAGGETAQPFYNRDSFKDTALLLAQGFGRMGIMGMEEIASDVAKQRTENKARNKTMEALSKMNTPQAQAAVEYINAGGDPVSALKMAFAKPEDDRTAMMKNYEFYISKGMSPEQAMAAVESGTTINMPGEPTIGTIPQGYQAVQDPATGTYRLEVLEGGPAAAEARDAEARQAKIAVQKGQKETVVGGAIDTLVGHIDNQGMFDLPEAGTVGNFLGRVGVNQDAVDFKNELASLQANIAFDRLQQMRDASKTGGALGAVSERELDLLMNAYGNIKQSTSPKRLRENLLTIKRIMTQIENDPVASQFYYGRDGSFSAQNQSSGVSVGEPY